MADNSSESENTNLIDVSDIEPTFENAPNIRGEAEEASDSISRFAAPELRQGPPVATFKDRFAALAIDLSFLYILYWISLPVYRWIAFGEAAGPIPASGINGVVFHALFLLIAFLWFVIPEMVFEASVGKLFSRLTVRGTDGDYASLPSILLRNVLLPVDIILSPLLVGTAIMELTSFNRRLGDIIGGTVVLKNLSNPPRQYALTLDMLATTSARAAAFLFDLILLAAFLFGFALMLSPENILPSMLIVVYSPLAIILFFILPECLTKTSPGKWIFGCTVCLESGASIDLPSSLVRTLWRIFDSNPFGFYTSLMSLRRQRPGDTAAQTVVISAPREWRGFVGLIASMVLIAGVIYAGLQNRDSFLSGPMEVNFLPSIDMRGLQATRHRAPANLMTKGFTFAAGDPATVRSPSIFQPGEMLYIVFEVDGYKRAASKVWLQEDINVRYPDDTLGLKLDNINEFNQELKEALPVRFENNIALPANATPGRYTVTITVRDKLARQELKEQRFFYITPAGSGTAPPPIPPVMP